MKYTPKEITENVNVSSSNPLRIFAIVLIKIIVILILLYLIIGVLVDFVAPRISIKTERKLGMFIGPQLQGQKRMEQEPYIQSILDSLVEKDSSLPGFVYTVHVINSEQVNAIALPGGSIVVFTGLLKEVGSENEIAMVLAHELGHFYHRDHLRGLGRHLLLLLLGSVFSSADSGIGQIIAPSITSLHMRFSQTQERAADGYALDLLNKKYGHVGGSLDFFAKMSKKDTYPKFLYVFSTHPYPESRRRDLEKRIKENHYRIENVDHLKF